MRLGFCLLLILLVPMSLGEFATGGGGEPDTTSGPPSSAPDAPSLLEQIREEVVERTIFRREARNHVRTLARQHRARQSIRPRRVQPAVEAGDWFESLELAIDTNYASVHDGQIGGSGHEGETTLTLTGNIGDALQLSLAHSVSRVDIGGTTPLEQNGHNTTLMASYLVTENLTLGAFVSFTQTDIEEQDVDDVWGAGLLASYAREIKGFDVGLTGTIASLTDNSSLADLFDSKDSVAGAIFDVSRSLSDALSATVYTGMYTALHNVTEQDQTFWSLGAELNYAPNDTMAIGLGYERTLDLESFQDHRVNASIAVNW
jgi:hypothetical protein